MRASDCSSGVANAILNDVGPCLALLVELVSFESVAGFQGDPGAMERAVALCRLDEVTVDDLPAKVQEHQSSKIVITTESPGELITLDEMERRNLATGTATLCVAGGMAETHQIDIMTRGIGALGYTIQRPLEDRFLMTTTELENKMSVLLGGRAAEKIVFSHLSTGAADDLDKATEVAHAMVTRFGMSSDLGLATFEREAAPFLQGAQASTFRTYNYSEKTAETIDFEVRGLLSRSFERARGVISQYRDVIELGARRLLERETIDEAELKTIWGQHVPPQSRLTGTA